jgi:glycosyltransferase involved in cell wall biosynthesis
MFDNNPAVTIVLATYYRPDALADTIESVLAQTYTDWGLLVIGDACSPRTGELVNSFDDHRIRYVNLPERCGEQSGPNSVGLAMADSPFVALLNHDDLWFPDHLARAIGKLEASGRDLFSARAAFSIKTRLMADRLTFTEVSPVERSLGDVIWKSFFLFEPASSLVLTRRAVDRMESWRSSLDGCRTPLEDWLLRGWRRGVSLACGEQVTVVKPRMMQGYDERIPGNDVVLDSIINTPDDFRAQISEDVQRSVAAGLSRSFVRVRNDEDSFAGACSRKLNRKMALLYYVSGFDRLEVIARASGLSNGHVLRSTLQRRTGESLRARPPLDALIFSARTQLDAQIRKPAGD